MMKKGFTLIELIIVVSIMAIFATVGIVNYFNARGQKSLEFTAEILVRELNLTMVRSRSQEDGQQWWVIFSNPAGNGNDLYYICYGPDYLGLGSDCTLADGSESKRVALGPQLQFTEPVSGTTKDAAFAKGTGLPVNEAGLPATTLVTINSTVGAGSKTITINPNGSIAF